MPLADPGRDEKSRLELPPGSRVALPGRGHPWVWDSGGRPGSRPVVLLHGWTSTAALTWQCTMMPLASTEPAARVIAPDLRGHGRGIRSRRPFRLEDAADDVAALLRVLGCGPVVAVGYSMGGPVAQLLWHRHPELVRGLVLCATAYRFARTTLSSSALAATGFSLGLGLATVPEVARRGLMQRASRASFPAGSTRRLDWAATEWAGSDPVGLLGAGAALLRYDASRWIGSVDVPTGIVVTTSDETVRPSAQRRLAAVIPGAEVHPVDGGHRSCVEAPRRFVPAFLDAWRGVERRATGEGPSTRLQEP